MLSRTRGETTHRDGWGRRGAARRALAPVATGLGAAAPDSDLLAAAARSPPAGVGAAAAARLVGDSYCQRKIFRATAKPPTPQAARRASSGASAA